MLKKKDLVSILFGCMFVFGGCGYSSNVVYESEDLMCRDGTISNIDLYNNNFEVDSSNFDEDVFKNYFRDFYLEEKRD